MRRSILAQALSAFVLAARLAAAEQGAERPLSAADAAAGKALYVQECSACHGVRGDGAGPAAEFVDPKPRSFIAGPFKLRTTPSGKPPATVDILRVIERGIPGTAMPSFAFLSEDERRKIAAYVLRLSDLLDEPEPEVVKVDAKGAPKVTPQEIARGRELYVDAGCAACHGEQGRGDGPSAKEMKDAQGQPVKPRDFTDGAFRGGAERVDLYYRLTTGLDGTPMPQYADVLEPADRWAVVDYVRTLQAPPAAKPLPADPLEAGRLVAEKYSCRGCHVLDDGRGSDVGPDLRVSGQKLQPEWVRGFLAAPRNAGKIYPFRASRMPHLGLSDAEVEVMVNYLAKVGNRPDKNTPLPDAAKFPAAQVEEGKNAYVLTCAQCHALGKVIETPVQSQQGPDLIRAAERVDYDWAKAWLADPKKIDAKTKMIMPNLKPEQIDPVRMFVWKAALAAPKATAGAGSTAKKN